MRTIFPAVRPAQPLPNEGEPGALPAPFSGLGFWSLDLATGTLTSTERCRLQFGRPAEAAFGYQEFLAALDTGDRAALLQALDELGNGREMDIECRIAAPGDTWRWLRLAAEPAAEHGDGRFRAVGISLDITEQKRAQAQAMRLHCAGKLAAGIGHDLNNLLAIASLCLKRVQVRVSPDHPAHPIATDASHAVLAAARQARSFLTMARGRPGNLRIVNIDRSVHSCLDLVRHAAGPGVVVSHEAGADSAFATVQPEQMDLALINLALNARDAMPGGGTLVIRTRCVAGRWVDIDMADNGDGIAAAHLARVFEPFFTTKSAGQGTGLGLPQVRDMARRSGGEASIQSAPGCGTTVTIRLPVAVQCC